MINLYVKHFQWVNRTEDDPDDQCAHGLVYFKVNDTVFVSTEDGPWTVSASALYLLRTITEDHTAQNPVAEGNFLFPCCGFNVWIIDNRFPVYCMGCSNGIDLEITHHNEMVTIRSADATEIVYHSEWAKAVLDFADSVREFYRSSSPKEVMEEEMDRQGWNAFWQEWDERVQMARDSYT